MGRVSYPPGKRPRIRSRAVTRLGSARRPLTRGRATARRQLQGRRREPVDREQGAEGGDVEPACRQEQDEHRSTQADREPTEAVERNIAAGEQRDVDGHGATSWLWRTTDTGTETGRRLNRVWCHDISAAGAVRVRRCMFGNMTSSAMRDCRRARLAPGQ